MTIVDSQVVDALHYNQHACEVTTIRAKGIITVIAGAVSFITQGAVEGANFAGVTLFICLGVGLLWYFYDKKIFRAFLKTIM